MSGEISWEEESEVREVIADIRDPDCELNWVIFGYPQGQNKVLSVIGAGDGGLDQMRKNLDDSQVLFVFLQLAERAFAFIQWCPDGASGVSRSRSSIHRSFVTSCLGSIAVDIMAGSLEHITQDKVDEELSYYYSTSGRQLDSSEAEMKLLEQEHRKKDTAKRQALAGNTHEAQRRLANLIAASSSNSRPTEAKIMPKIGGTNVSKKTPQKHLSSTLFEKAKISVELEDEDNLKELMLDLREAEINGDFNWMILSYVENKKNTLALLETGNGGRQGLVEYLDADHSGARDKVLYILIKEDDSCNKCTFVSWIGIDVPAFQKASFSTHRGAISKWMTEIIHNLQEEYVQSGNDLLGLKDEPTDEQGSDRASNPLHTARIHEVEKQVQSKPYAGKVLDEVKRDKTPQELWMERKQDPGSRTPTASEKKNLNEMSHLDFSGMGEPDKEFTQIQLKNRSNSSRAGGRSKYARKSTDPLNSSRRSGEGDAEVSSLTKSELQAAARKASSDAERLEEEAAAKRAAAKKLQHAANHAHIDTDEVGGSTKGSANGGCSQDSLDEEGVGGPDSAAPPEEHPTLNDEADPEQSTAGHTHFSDEQTKSRLPYGEGKRHLNGMRMNHDDSHSRLPRDRSPGAGDRDPQRNAVGGRGMDQTKVHDFDQAHIRAEPAKGQDERNRLQAEAEQRKTKEQEERERLKAEAERKAREQEERERLKAEEERKARELEERERAASRHSEADTARSSDLRIKVEPSGTAGAHKAPGSPGMSSPASPKDAFAERKAALLAEAGSMKRGDEDDLRRKAEELLARKRAQLEEASRLRVAAQQHQAESAAAHHAAEAGSEPAAAGAADSADQDRLKRAEIFRQKKMAELASRRGTDVDGAAAAKKAAFLKEAEEAVRRATLQETARRRAAADGEAQPGP